MLVIQKYFCNDIQMFSYMKLILFWKSRILEFLFWNFEEDDDIKRHN